MSKQPVMGLVLAILHCYFFRFLFTLFALQLVLMSLVSNMLTTIRRALLFVVGAIASCRLRTTAIAVPFLITIAVFSPAQTPRRAETTTNDASTAPAGRRAEPSSTNRPALGAISGRVTSEDGQPLPKATVRIFAMGSQVRSQPIPLGPDGSFQAADLAPALYTVSVSAPGYVRSIDPNLPDEQAYHRIGETLNLRLVRGGVITGKIIGPNNEPVIGVPVKAIRTKTQEGKVLPSFQSYDRFTDDRGIYRIFGVPAGTYVVAAGGGIRFAPLVTGFEQDALTYYPSATREGATEIVIHNGDEETGIDIRYRGEQGHSISGTVEMPEQSPGNAIYSTSLTLSSVSTGNIEYTQYVQPSSGDNGFEFAGVADGRYFLSGAKNSGGNALSATTAVTVNGADASGVKLRLVPTGGVDGQLVMETPPLVEHCKASSSVSFSEFLIGTQREREKATAGMTPVSLASGGPAVPNDKGEFKLNGLVAGSYHFGFELPGDQWFIRSIQFSAPEEASGRGAARKVSEITPAGYAFSIKTGERKSGVIITASPGGAAVRGRLTPTTKGQRIPEHVLLTLIPIDTDKQKDPLRFAESFARNGGAFYFNKLAPGSYYILARPVSEEEFALPYRQPSFSTAKDRADLVKLAETNKILVDLQACQSKTDLVVPVAAK
jgi:Carboxypeptidase regulatory-like domain